jgi:predicted GNAT superfamily acetyltransferase
MALGRMRADICVVYKEGKYPIELKILQNQRSLAESLKQTAAYMDRMGTAEGWLVLFDKDREKNWDEKIYMRKESVDNRVITVVGC